MNETCLNMLRKSKGKLHNFRNYIILEICKFWGTKEKVINQFFNYFYEFFFKFLNSPWNMGFVGTYPNKREEKPKASSLQNLY